jgi:hypothetical protein
MTRSTINAVKSLNIRKLGVSHFTDLKPAAILTHELQAAFFFNLAGIKTMIQWAKITCSH